MLGIRFPGAAPFVVALMVAAACEPSGPAPSVTATDGHSSVDVRPSGDVGCGLLSTTPAVVCTAHDASTSAAVGLFVTFATDYRRAPRGGLYQLGPGFNSPSISYQTDDGGLVGALPPTLATGSAVITVLEHDVDGTHATLSGSLAAEGISMTFDRLPLLLPNY